jgi:hypothetical protein
MHILLRGAEATPSVADGCLDGVVESLEENGGVLTLSRGRLSVEECLQQLRSLHVAATDEQDHDIAITQCPEMFIEGLCAVTHGLRAFTHGLHALTEDVTALKSDIAAITSRITEVQSTVAKLSAQPVRNEQALMLAQVPYKLDDIVARYVFEDHLHTTLFEIRVAARSNELSHDEQLRLAKVQAFFNSKGFTYMRLQSAQNVLERPRFSDHYSVTIAAHNSYEAQLSAENANKKSLLTLAAALHEEDIAVAIELIELLCFITGDEQPLTATVDMAAVMNSHMIV